MLTSIYDFNNISGNKRQFSLKHKDGEVKKNNLSYFSNLFSKNRIASIIALASSSLMIGVLLSKTKYRSNAYFIYRSIPVSSALLGGLFSVSNFFDYSSSYQIIDLEVKRISNVSRFDVLNIPAIMDLISKSVNLYYLDPAIESYIKKIIDDYAVLKNINHDVGSELKDIFEYIVDIADIMKKSRINKGEYLTNNAIKSWNRLFSNGICEKVFIDEISNSNKDDLPSLNSLRDSSLEFDLEDVKSKLEVLRSKTLKLIRELDTLAAFLSVNGGNAHSVVSSISMLLVKMEDVYKFIEDESEILNNEQGSQKDEYFNHIVSSEIYQNAVESCNDNYKKDLIELYDYNQYEDSVSDISDKTELPELSEDEAEQNNEKEKEAENKNTEEDTELKDIDKDGYIRTAIIGLGSVFSVLCYFIV